MYEQRKYATNTLFNAEMKGQHGDRAARKLFEYNV